MAEERAGTSFYFFDFDDNIMFLETPILLRNKQNGETRIVSTHEFATIRTMLGTPGEWLEYEQFEQTEDEEVCMLLAKADERPRVRTRHAHRAMERRGAERLP